MAPRLTSALGALVLLAASAEASVTLSVNHNDVSMTGNSAQPILMGALDPNVISIDGPADARYLIIAGPVLDGSVALLPSQLPLTKITGVLDGAGHADVILSPETLREGDRFGLQAAVGDASATPGFALSPIANIDVVRTMASNIVLTLPAGSTADVLGPVMAVDDTSVTIGNLTFEVSPKTQYERISGLGDVQLGQWLAIDGEYTAQGTLVGLEIVPEDAEPNVRLRSRIQGLGPAGFAMLGVSVFTSPSTEYTDAVTGAPSSFGALVEGMIVEVRIPAETSYPHVVEMTVDIRIENEPEPEPEPEPEDTPPPSFCS